MADTTKIIEVQSKDLNKAIEGLETKRRNRIVIERAVMPIIFVPGIMGSRLKNQTGDTVWDPDDPLFMLKTYGRRKADAEFKKSMLIGEQFNDEYLQVLNDDKEHNKKFADKYDKTRADRGWGGVMWSSSGKILKALQSRQWDQTVNLFFEFPVHAFGYNWTTSNDLSGQKLADEINNIIKKYTGMGRQCDKVLLVTHSMGGLVARSACMLHGAMDKVLGIVHGAQPSNGSPAAYWRMKGDFERPHSIPDIDFIQWFKNPVKKAKHLIKNAVEGEGVGIPYTDLKLSLGNVPAWVLGTDGEEVTALLGNMPGGLELLPNKQYKNNDGWDRWLELLDSEGNRKALPEADPYREIYCIEEEYYRLINPVWLNPGSTNDSANFEGTAWKSYRKYLKQAETFHDDLAEKTLHAETYQFYSSGMASPDRIVFNSADDTLWETIKRKFGILKSKVPDYLTDEAQDKMTSLVFSPVKSAVASLLPTLIDAGSSMISTTTETVGKPVSSLLVTDSDWYVNRGGYRDRVNDKNIPTKDGKLQLVTMELPDGAGDGTVPESSAKSLKLGNDKKRTFCIADKNEFEKSFADKHKRLKPQQKPDFDEGYFDRGHEGIFKTQSAQFITHTALENICRQEIKRLLGQ